MKYLNEVVLATLNQGKVKEFQDLCKDYQVSIISGSTFSKELPLETGETFEENAFIKAKYMGKISGLPSLADDSGLCINALNGFPGIYSARWTESNGGYVNTIKELSYRLVDIENITASFVCVLALYLPLLDKVEYFRYDLQGTLTFPPKGNSGFGYDSIFTPLNCFQTFAEMPKVLKNQVSHRFQAFKIFANKCLQKN